MQEGAINASALARYMVAKAPPRGWTQGELAYHAGVSQSLISRILTGDVRTVRLSTAQKLASALGVQVQDLLTPPPEEPAPVLPTGRILTPARRISIPVLGVGPAGGPRQTWFLELDRIDLDPEATFGVEVSGDSLLDDGIRDGWIMLCERRSNPQNGDLVYARIGDETVLRHWERHDDHVTLVPGNHKYTNMLVRDVEVLGVCKRFIGEVPMRRG